MTVLYPFYIHRSLLNQYGDPWVFDELYSYLLAESFLFTASLDGCFYHSWISMRGRLFI